jgi:rare lipoprotein A
MLMPSYYADKFHGRRTASGVPFDRDKYTAAHKKLPLELN